MTVKERLNQKLLNLIKDVDGLLADQDLNGGDTYTKEIGDSAGFNLAYANGLIEILIMPNVTQGDWSKSWGGKDNIMKIISNIFEKYDPDNNPYAPVMKNASNRW